MIDLKRSVTNAQSLAITRTVLADKKTLKPAFQRELEACHLHGQSYAFEMILEYIKENKDISVNDIEAHFQLLLSDLLTLVARGYYRVPGYALTDILEIHGHYEKYPDCHLSLKVQDQLRKIIKPKLEYLKDNDTEETRDIAYEEYKKEIARFYFGKKDYEAAIKVGMNELNI